MRLDSLLSVQRMSFVELVMKARPQIKDDSAKAYATSLKLLAPDGASTESLDFILDWRTSTPNP